MNKSDFITVVATELECSNNVAEHTINSILDVIVVELGKGNDISLKGFGTFKIKETKSRNGRNPKTGESIVIPARKKVTFKASPKLQEK